MSVRLLFFGTSAGIEPMKGGMHHCAFAVETGGFYYWFDAGENCSRTAAEMDVDLLHVKTIFVSHAHPDHIGGLANLLWSIRKLTVVGKGLPPEGKLFVTMPDPDAWRGVLAVLGIKAEAQISDKFDVTMTMPAPGCVYEDERIRVSAVPNLHMPTAEDGRYTSFSYVIETEGKKIVFSGDVKALRELEPCLEGGCDVLICETGHHKVADACALAKQNGVGRLLFSHNGREIINHRAEVEVILSGYDGEAEICYDKMEISL